MKITFWSSVECGGFMNAIVAACRNRGYDVYTDFSVSAENYCAARSLFSRLILRIRMYIIYPLILFFKVIIPKREILVICSNTFYAPFIADLFNFTTQRKIIHLVYDLFPDALIESNLLKRNSWFHHFIDRLQKYTLCHSDANVFLGEYLLKYVKSRFAQIQKAEIIPVGAVSVPFLNNMPQLINGMPLNEILYCGNFGKFHDSETLLQALQKEEAVDILPKFKFRFCASGPLYSQLKTSIGLTREDVRRLFSFEGNLADADWENVLKMTPIALVTMRSGGEKIIMPSKTYSAMLAGQAILAIAPLNSDLAELIRMHDCGWVIAPNDTDGLLKILREMASNPELLLEKRRNAYSAGHRYYSAGAVAEKWCNLFSALTNLERCS